MELKPEHITIAVTVFSRRQFVLDAIRSALNQTVPVKVIVVEDCGLDSSIRNLIVGEFGNRIEYFRNPRNRGRSTPRRRFAGRSTGPWPAPYSSMVLLSGLRRAMAQV